MSFGFTTFRFTTAVVIVLAVFAAAGVVGTDWFAAGTWADGPSLEVEETDPRNSKRRNAAQSKRARREYFFRMLKDPETNAIPGSIRQRELAYARTLPAYGTLPGKDQTAPYVWQEVGPFDVGGRTRAVAVDARNSDIVLAGGVSGGIWRSTDRGRHWTLTTDPSAQQSVTAIAQDPRSGHRDTWYAVSGEYPGRVSDQGSTASYFGSGLYRSTDNGGSWQRIRTAGRSVAFDSFFDFVSDVAVSPTSGDVFLAVNAVGICRLDSTGDRPEVLLGGVNQHRWSDLDIGPNGRIAAVVSDAPVETSASNTPGVYVSSDDGDSWANVTPESFPDALYRSVLALAPSNPDIAYVYTYTGRSENGTEDIRFHRLNLADSTAEDRTANLPPAAGDGPQLDTQHGYNMALAVKPDDEEFVLLGAKNLFRSRNGFSHPPVSGDPYWIGGYDPEKPAHWYPNHHPDQHALVFDPSRPDRLWSGHDGGLTLVEDAASNETPLPWIDRNRGYNVTQFYSVAIPDRAADPRIMGGTQDNGTPFFRTTDTDSSSDVSTGDGGYAYFADDYALTSSQDGRVYRLNYENGSPDWSNSVEAYPSEASGQMFIHPYAVDPQNEDVMIYPEKNHLWRTSALTTETGGSSGGEIGGWRRLDSLGLPDGFRISALTFSSQPAHVLYYAGSREDALPRIYRLPGADAAETGQTEIPLPVRESGAYVHDIAVNPYDANEILVVLSNYNIVGLFHSTDGGDTYAAVEGNLRGHYFEPGPSMRSATIVPTERGTAYYVGTSTGLFSTGRLDSMSTQWTLQAGDLIGHAIVEDVTSRPSDGTIAAATHGRGLFVGRLGTGPAGGPREPTNVVDNRSPDGYALAQNYPNPFNPTTTVSYTVPTRSTVTMVVYDMQGREVLRPLDREPHRSGDHRLTIDAGGLASGAYVYRLTVSDEETPRTAFTRSRVMTVVK